jgi:fumarate reductase flavoprotein subunit
MNIINKQISPDIIVVGAGTAGLPCAIRAAQRGQKVLVIEKSDEIGGTLHLTAGHMSAAGTKRQKEKGIEDSPDNHYNEVMEISSNTADPAIVKLATSLAPQTLDWLTDLGFPFAAETPAIIYGHVPYKIPRTHWGSSDYAGGKIALPGISIFNTLRPLFEEQILKGNITLLLNHRLVEIVLENEHVVGVKVEGENQTKIYAAPKVVLTTGGYASNHEFFRKVTPDAPRLITTARSTSTGDGIEAAIAIGARFRGGEMHTSTLGGLELEPNSGRTDFWSYWARVSNSIDRPPREIYVNENAVRFMDENEPDPDIREKTVQDQPGRRFWLIFDEKALSDGQCIVPQWTYERLKQETLQEKAMWQADSIEELAQKTGLNPKSLSNTVAHYNMSVAAQFDERFGRKYLKNSIVEPPFYAVLTYAFSLITFGGLHINDHLQVLNQNQHPIEGLYAAGEIIGASATSGFAFCGGMLLTPALSFGKYLGENL